MPESVVWNITKFDGTKTTVMADAVHISGEFVFAVGPSGRAAGVWHRPREVIPEYDTGGNA